MATRAARRRAVAGDREVSVSGTAVQGGRRLRLRVLGFPVHIDLSFVIIMSILGYGGMTRGSLRDLGIWLLVATASVLIHELGHAVVARTTGASPEIALTGFGGVTTWVPPAQLSRVRSLAISLAGPLVGLVAGMGLLVLWRSVGDSLDGTSWQRTAIWYGVWTCLGWSVINLLPVLPLDGGQAMRELLPGSQQVRARRAARVSIVAVLPVVAVAFWLQQPWVGLFFLFFGVSNELALRQAPPGLPQGGPAGQVAPMAPEQAVVALLWQGAADQARRTMEELPPGTTLDLAVHGAVMALTGQPDQGFALLHQEFERRPGDPNVAALLVLARALGHDWAGLDAELRGPAGAAAPGSVLQRAAQEAIAAGRADVAERITTAPERG
jgi:Zn-dependent protease